MAQERLSGAAGGWMVAASGGTFIMLLHESLHVRGVSHKSDGDVGREQVRDRVVVARADEAHGLVQPVREGFVELVGGVYPPGLGGEEERFEARRDAREGERFDARHAFVVVSAQVVVRLRHVVGAIGHGLVNLVAGAKAARSGSVVDALQVDSLAVVVRQLLHDLLQGKRSQRLAFAIGVSGCAPEAGGVLWVSLVVSLFTLRPLDAPDAELAGLEHPLEQTLGIGGCRVLPLRPWGARVDALGVVVAGGGLECGEPAFGALQFHHGRVDRLAQVRRVVFIGARDLSGGSRRQEESLRTVVSGA
eukprot:scaffold42751_cov59-Phaeocystis_antarctica.AAC.2